MKTNSPSFLGIKKIDLSDNTAVTSGGGTNVQTLRPPDGLIYKICKTEMSIPAIGGASGNHDQNVYAYDGSNNHRYWACYGTDGALFSANNSYGLAADTELPSATQQQHDLLHNEKIILNYDNYLRCVYTNNSDTNQTGTRTLIFWVAIYKELL